MSSLSSLVPPSWQPLLSSALAADSFVALSHFLASEEESGATLCPPRAQVFAALAHTPPERVRAVIIGQDPYPTFGNANGLCFSVSPGVKTPASLRNIFAALSADVGMPMPTSGDLSALARRGVLLLNTVLTVREGEANSHRNRGWEPFTRAVLEQVNALPGPVVFFCLGKHAQALASQLIDATKHAVFNEPHPSPLNGRKFVDSVKTSRIFSRANEVLSAAGREPIDWSLG